MNYDKLEEASKDSDLGRYLAKKCSYCDSARVKPYLLSIHRSGLSVRSICNRCLNSWSRLIIKELSIQDIFTLQLLCNIQT